MGVGFSHGGASWSYTGFNYFRKLLAESIGLDLYDMHGFYTEEERAEAIRNGSFPYGDPPQKRPWSEIDDPIVGLMHHSDCDGHITPEQCRIIAPRLRELIADWPDTMKAEWSDKKKAEPLIAAGYKETYEFSNYDKDNGFLLAAGMEQAAEKGQNFEFH